MCWSEAALQWPVPWDSPSPGAATTPVGGLLDPHRSNTPYEVTMWHWVGNMVVRLGVKDGLPEPDLVAAMPEIPGDGTEIVFKVNPNAKWQNKAPTNGRAVTAEDIKLSTERIKNPATTSLRVSNCVNVESITVVEPLTFRLKLKVPQADLWRPLRGHL